MVSSCYKQKNPSVLWIWISVHHINIYQQSDNRDSTDFECVTCFANKDFYHMLHTIFRNCYHCIFVFLPDLLIIKLQSSLSNNARGYENKTLYQWKFTWTFHPLESVLTDNFYIWWMPMTNSKDIFEWKMITYDIKRWVSNLNHYDFACPNSSHCI